MKKEKRNVSGGMIKLSSWLQQQEPPISVDQDITSRPVWPAQAVVRCSCSRRRCLGNFVAFWDFSTFSHSTAVPEDIDIIFGFQQRSWLMPLWRGPAGKAAALIWWKGHYSVCQRALIQSFPNRFLTLSHLPAGKNMVTSLMICFSEGNCLGKQSVIDTDWILR